MYFAGLAMGIMLSGLAVLFIGNKKFDRNEQKSEQELENRQRAEIMWRENMYFEAVAMTTHNVQLDELLKLEIERKNNGNQRN